MRRLARLLVPLLAVPLVTGPAMAEARPLARYYSQHLAWSGCGGGFECADLKVPLDYGKPNGEQLKIKVIRLKASGKDRIGSVVLNPGGPGGSGVDYAKAAKTVVSPQIRARFDVVGFDPRGVAGSSPVHCVTSKQMDRYAALDSTPDTPAEAKALRAGAKEFADSCKARAGRILAHVGTADAARDMDVLRAALGDKGLTYLGKSYGTYLGATYADLFPRNVRTMVLDGALDPTLSSFKLNVAQAKGFEVAFAAFAEDCFKAQDCPFAGSTADAAFAETAALLKKADKKPLRNTQDKRKINESIAVMGILTPLYDHQAWPVLRIALKQAFKGDGTILLRISDLYYERKDDGSYSNQTDANLAVNCLDHPTTRNPAVYEKQAREAAKIAPHFGAYIGGGANPCVYWPVKATGKDRALHAKGAPPILVVGTKRDPATPYAWAQALATQLKSGVLLSYDGDGHTAYRTGSTCVDKAVDAYLIGKSVPETRDC
ncbi:alpha/beta hydrolase [Nonomuraea sp. NPDC050536]|uniref:alpha/beta hydrolase n=1 Tax=Nonomuraea sp. NPDC050536 TaxID=3364366 RepID=UPI0037CA0B0F